MKSGSELIAIERQEQIEKHNRTLSDDISYNKHYQLSQAASLLCYVDEEEVGGEPNDEDDTHDFGSCCPSDWDSRKGGLWNKMMNKTYEQRLIIAGALIAAEIDRLQNIK